MDDCTPVIVEQTNHGIDGWDAKKYNVAMFDHAIDAKMALKGIGFYVDWDGKPASVISRSVYHKDKSARWQMGHLSYRLIPVESLPHNTIPDPYAGIVSDG